MIDQIRRDIQALLDELLKEVDKLRRALAALTSRESESEPAAGDHAAPVTRSAAGESAKSARAATSRALRTRSASVPPRPPAPTPAPAQPLLLPARGPRRARPRPPCWLRSRTAAR